MTYAICKYNSLQEDEEKVLKCVWKFANTYSVRADSEGARDAEGAEPFW